MTVAAGAFLLLLLLGVPIGFVLLGASVAYFALNPVMTVGAQIMEVLRAHSGLDREAFGT